MVKTPPSIINSKTYKIAIRNIINVLTQVKNSKEKINKINRFNFVDSVDSKPLIDPKEIYVQNFNTELESQLYQELTCINTTIADVGKIKK
tara:strand:+ start:166 stop:438 length:273 start_codon:yes stop_codon:yes gene_type:complete